MHYNFELAPSFPTHRLRMKSSGFNSVTRYLLYILVICCLYSFEIQSKIPVLFIVFRIFQTLYVSLVVSSVLPLLLVPFEHILETRMCVGYVGLFFLRCTHPLSGEAWGTHMKVIGMLVISTRGMKIYRFWFHLS